MVNLTLTLCRDKAFALHACTASYRGGDMLGQAELAKTCSSTIQLILAAFYGYVKLCSDWG